MVRYKPSQFTKKELEAMVGVLALDKGLDMLTGGRINKLSKKAAVAAYRMVVRPIVTRAAIPAVASVARAGLGASRILMTNPYILGATAVYVGYQERERIRALLEQGYEITEEPVTQYLGEVEQRGREFLADPIGGIQESYRGMREERKRFQAKFPTIRKPSKFNKAIKAGMLAVKKSPSYGGKGVIKPTKGAFTLVTKLASAKKKKKKAPKSGLRRRIWNAMKGLR